MRSRSSSRAAWAALPLASVVAGLTLATGSGAAQTADGSGASYWGPIPPVGDSVRALFANRPRPVWETAVLVPYWIVGFPLRLLTSGIGEAVEFADESGVASTVAGWLGPRKGPFGVIFSGRAGGLRGPGGGLALEYTELFGRPGTSIRGRLAGTLIGDVRTGGALRIPASSTVLDIGGGYRFRNRVRYFGLGPERIAADESLFRQRTWWIGAEVRQTLGSGFTAGGTAHLTGVKPLDTRADEDRGIPITVRYADSLPDGFGTTSTGITVAGEVRHQDAPETGRPQTGGARRAVTGYFRETGAGNTAFWSLRGELQQFVPLWFPHHVLALRLVAAWLQQVGDAPIPFTRLLTNDDPDLFRGYDDYRWRGRGLAVLSAEYRWPLWAYERADGPGIDLYLLTDVGQVFDAVEQIDADHLTFSYGAGLRFVTASGFVFRIEHARSGEDAVWRLRGDQIFQFFRSALYHAREPTPAR